MLKLFSSISVRLVCHSFMVSSDESRWLGGITDYGRESEQTLGDGEGQGGLGSHRVGHD